MKQKSWLSYHSSNAPEKSGMYEVLYTRAKSKQITTGTASYRKRDKQWTEITNNRTGQGVGSTYDYRDNRLVSPTVVAWR